MNKETIKQTAEKLFASTSHDVLWANPKGEFFTSVNIGILSLEKDEKLIKFERTQVAEPAEDKKVKPADQKEVIAAILKVETLEGLKPYETDERKAVKSVYANVLAKLTAQIPVVGATPVTAQGQK